MKPATTGKMMYPRAVRKQQIEEVIALRQMVDKKPSTMRQIARGLNMSPSNHLMELLWEMADEQRLIPKPREYRQTMTAWDFKLPPDRAARIVEKVYQGPVGK